MGRVFQNNVTQSLYDSLLFSNMMDDRKNYYILFVPLGLQKRLHEVQAAEVVREVEKRWIQLDGTIVQEK